MRSSQCLFSTLAFCCILAAGCGSGEQIPSLVPVEGTVTINGEPGSDLIVTFMPEASDKQSFGTSIGKTDGQGKYSLTYKGTHPGAPAGRYRVSISQANEAEVPDEKLLPAHYNRETNLTAEITPEPKSYDFALETKR